MIFGRRTKPKKEYIWKIILCIIAYFSINAIISKILIENKILTVESSFSFIFTPDKIPVFEFLYKIIPVPYFYLYPIIPLLILFFIGLSRIFKNYKVSDIY